ncbi:serine/threonine-protein kinase [Nocardia rhizosphaerae]|uniref:Serine/threonine-protein kinase n=1 Tax=Nocardia rhizosphaerae TaxID=1691571 RepID=A0ABV8L068_9NOCA
MHPLGTDDPRRIGSYRLLGVLGSGGMGKVYLGRTAGGRTVAVKVIRPDLHGDAEFRARFRREVAAARRVDGAFTAPVLDADVDAVPPWLATGFVAGLPLSDAVARFGPLDERALLALGRGLAAALAAIHGAGVVHRDLKPSNVLLAVDGPKVIDFGIARAVGDTALTTTGKVIGSPGFMCPEQVRGTPLGAACDVFAIGGVLTFAATGHGPFGAAELAQLLWRIIYEQPRLDALPARIRPLVASCLVKDPDARPAPLELLVEFERLADPAHTEWLPPALIAEIGTRAVRLLDLDTGPDEHPVIPQPRTANDTHPRNYAGPYRTDRDPMSPRATDTEAPSMPISDHADRLPAHRIDSTAPAITPAVGVAPSSPRGSARHTRLLLTAGVVVTAVAVAVGAYLIGTRLGSDDKDNPMAARTTTTAGVGATASTPRADTASGAVPAAFLGTWTGRARDGLASFDVELTIGAGEAGQEVAASANIGVVSGERCTRAETLTEVGADRLVFRARLTGTGTGLCLDEGATSTVVLRPDGGLDYSTPGVLGGSIAGVLHLS